MIQPHISVPRPRRLTPFQDLIKDLEASFRAAPPKMLRPSNFRTQLPAPARVLLKPGELRVYRRPLRQAGQGRVGLWLGPEALDQTPEKIYRQVLVVASTRRFSE